MFLIATGRRRSFTAEEAVDFLLESLDDDLDKHFTAQELKRAIDSYNAEEEGEYYCLS